MKTFRRNKIAFHISAPPIAIDWRSSLCNFLLPPRSTQLLPSAASVHVLPSVLQTNTKVKHTHTHTHKTVLPVTFLKETHTVTPTRYSSVGIGTTLRATRSRVWIPTAAGLFLHSNFSRPIQFKGVTRQARYFGGKNEWSYTSTPPIWPDGVDKHNCTLYWFRHDGLSARPSAHHVTNIKPNNRFSSILKSAVFNMVYRNKHFVKIACKYRKLSTRRRIPFCGSAATVVC
jgi:hypothetical protein